jgi:hypothetical protein
MEHRPHDRTIAVRRIDRHFLGQDFESLIWPLTEIAATDDG